MGALLAGSRELGPDEYHRKLNHVRNCQTCTGPFVKTLIAQLIYLVLCGIRLIPHGTRLARVCIFRYTWAGSCHGWNSYGTRRPRVCGVPCVTSSRVPAGGMPGTLLPPVYGTPANWGQACAAGAPPVLVRPEFRATVQTRPRRVPARSTARTREGRVYGAPASSARVCTRNPSAVARTRTDLAESCELAADVCRQPAWRQLSTAFLTCPAAQGGRRSRPHATAPPVPVQKDGQEEPLPSPVFSPNRYRPQSRRLPQSQRTLGSTPTSSCARE